MLQKSAEAEKAIGYTKDAVSESIHDLFELIDGSDMNHPTNQQYAQELREAISLDLQRLELYARAGVRQPTVAEEEAMEQIKDQTRALTEHMVDTGEQFKQEAEQSKQRTAVLSAEIDATSAGVPRKWQEVMQAEKNNATQEVGLAR